MSRRKRRATETFSLSFLDCICCGFGAIILLIVITKIYEPRLREETDDQTEARLMFLNQRLEDLAIDSTRTAEQLSVTEAELARERQRLAQLQRELARIETAFDDVRDAAMIAEELEGRLNRARQRLTEEMQRLLADFRRRPADAPVGGIPIDSEYIIFVIDTSPSMTEYTWGRMMETMEEILDVYPEVKGMQVMNDMGTYLFTRYAGEWITDTPALRRAVMDGLRGWRPFSNSSPVEGISVAVRTFATRQHGVSIYYLGDEMHGHNLDHAARQVQRVNRGPDGQPMARIHSIGFPVIYDYTGSVQATGLRFAVLMRIICEQNNGTFVALHSGRGRR
jgi:hypothetical protein